MEIILTVLSTLGVGALAYAFVGVIRLSRRVRDLELVRMELVDLEQDTLKRFDEWNASIDRRFDKVWGDVHRIDNDVNPNKDIIIK